MPYSLPSMLKGLDGQEPALGLFLLGAGLVFLLMGARIFKILLVISFGWVGYMIGVLLPVEPLWQILSGAILGIALAVAANYLARIGVAVLAGGWFAVVVSSIAEGFGLQSDIVLVLAGLAFLAVVSLAFVMNYEIIAAVFSFEGSLLVMGGLVVLLSQYSGMWGKLRGLLLETPLLFGFLLLTGTVTGYYAQLAERQKKQIGTSG